MRDVGLALGRVTLPVTTAQQHGSRPPLRPMTVAVTAAASGMDRSSPLARVEAGVSARTHDPLPSPTRTPYGS